MSPPHQIRRASTPSIPANAYHPQTRRGSSSVISAFNHILGPQSSDNVNSALQRTKSHGSIGDQVQKTRSASNPRVRPLRNTNPFVAEASRRSSAPNTPSIRRLSLSSSHNSVSSSQSPMKTSPNTENPRRKGKRHSISGSTPLSQVQSATPTKPLTYGDKYLAKYLKRRGFLPQKHILSGNEMTISFAATGNQVFLPTQSTQADEYLADVTGTHHHDFDSEEDDLDQLEESSVINDSILLTDTNSLQGVPAPNDRTIQIDESMSNYSFALIFSIAKPTKITNIEVELLSRCKVFWSKGVPPSKTFKEEIYKVASKKWSLTSSNFNVFIPSTMKKSAEAVHNTNGIRKTELLKNIKKKDRIYGDKNRSIRELFKSLDKSNPQKLKPGKYVFVFPIVFSNHIPETFTVPSGRVDYMICIASKFLNPFRTNDESVAPLMSSELNSSSLSLQSTESMEKDIIHSETSHKSIFHKNRRDSISASTDTVISELNDRTNLYAEYPIKVVRQPPSVSISTANRPIYIDRVWSDSLSYEISFDKKFIPLNGKVPVRIKLSPLNKTVSVKRVRVSVVEKITFVSKNFEYEYEQVDLLAKDPYNPYYLDFQSRRRKQRNFSLLEVRTKENGSHALREEVIDNTVCDNILSYTAVTKPAKTSKHKKKLEDDIECISDQWVMNTILEFPKHEEGDKHVTKYLAPYGIDTFQLTPNLEKGPPEEHSRHGSVMSLFSSSNATPKKTEHHKTYDKRFHQTKIKSNSGVSVKSHTILNTAKRGLYVDSLNFSNISVKHKLEIMFRISKKEMINGQYKMKNYEVLIDIPIVLVSELCDSGNMELPAYDSITDSTFLRQGPCIDGPPPPTFEDAISIPSTPMGSPLISPIRFADNNEDLCGFTLSRKSSLGGGPSTRSALFDAPSGASSNKSSRTGISNSLATQHSALPSTQGDSSYSSNESQSVFKKGYSLSQGNSSYQQNLVPRGEEYASSINPGANLEPPSYEEVVPAKPTTVSNGRQIISS
ncbi:hypothetical protein TBLA_0I00950 [Henningerozyma blattae CBS 6284]|uniref:Arrestin C-terminal-like domain-containing protein n=1 Tax=Henningerozyma blattae (strain ATCC 34711 / CBS 6284 / DSM 70876 / NBRC 10599 / NRRL Y-10934 / UCD 77-7) TaxID=1071380 RepID=I2H8Q2_HENB6|nr:hypothetical protein TBLA_0I00950 [Tetrapisispora blattae CBS 6284]CCH62754.1 hypothetical protein TBLA_0I00950 [Tetrapisispora blattae CBS 6284]